MAWLGPWHRVVERLGVHPRGTPMNAFFGGYGVAWLPVGAAFARGAGWASATMLAAAVGAVWYLPAGTALSLIQAGLLLLQRFRGG